MTEPNLAGVGPEGVSEKKRRHAQAKWDERHPLAKWAHMCLASALRRGLLQRQPCEVCGEGPADGHHDDYTRPLVVRWLCRRHHQQHHAQEARNAG